MPAVKPCDLSIAVVSFNTRELTLACLRSVFEHCRELSFELIVVDNASSDGSPGAIAEALPDVHLIESTENLGFAAANNLAARHARGEHLLLLNPDTLIRDDAIEKALARLRDRPDVGALGARTLYGDGSLNATSCFGPITLWSLLCTAAGLSVVLSGSPLFNPAGIGGWARDTEREVGTITGCFFLVRTALWRELGGFDERFFMYGEDVDLSDRIRRAGYRCLLFPGATIVHYGGRSDSVRAQKMVKVNRARSQVMVKQWRSLPARLGIALIDAAVGSRVLVHRLLSPLRPASVAKRDMWREVWRERHEWRRPIKEEGMTPKVRPHPVEGRARLAFRWARFALRSVRAGHFDFARNALRAEWQLARQTAAELLPSSEEVECNICGWKGRGFLPNTGPGYDDVHTTCPGCRGLSRHRSLLAILRSTTDFFEPGARILEVAPMRGFEAVCRSHPGCDYTSIDLERHAMERGDITNLRFENDSADYFVCFHVLEHIPNEARAVREIHRVLRPGGCAVLQVPVDWDAEHTREYDGPNPRDVGHVRRHGRDFPARIAAAGFDVEAVRASEVLPPEQFSRQGLCDEPVFLARKRA